MKILYVDDEQTALNKFSASHAKDGMSLETCRDVRTLSEILSRRKCADLPVMDLYATIDTIDSQDAVETNNEVDRLVAEIAKTRDRLRCVVDRKKRPHAVDVLRILRKSPKLKDIPVILNTREGMALIGDDLFQESITLGAHWMLKRQAGKVQREIMTRVVEESRLRRKLWQRDVKMTLIGAFLGAILGVIVSALWNSIWIWIYSI